MNAISAPSTGNRLGKFLVVRKIGSGGMAEVFKCRLTGIGGFTKLVVIKRIRPELATEPQFVDMFLDEARIAANLNHTNIVQIFEIDQAAGIPYIVMEYVRGPTLGQLTRLMRSRQRPNLAVAAKLMSGICSGLDHAHNAVGEDGSPLGIIHRDVTPQNILVSLEGVPKLTDFGVARARGQLADTEAGSIKGKFKFMAPEAFLGERSQVTRQLDLFAAGVCLYHATTFHLPYPGKTELEVLREAAAGKFARPSELVPGFCPRLEQIILSAMAPQPKDRCADALTLHRQLEEYAQQRGCTQATVSAFVRDLFPLDQSGEPTGCSSLQLEEAAHQPPPAASPRPSTPAARNPSTRPLPPRPSAQPPQTTPGSALPRASAPDPQLRSAHSPPAPGPGMQPAPPPAACHPSARPADRTHCGSKVGPRRSRTTLRLPPVQARPPEAPRDFRSAWMPRRIPSRLLLALVAVAGSGILARVVIAPGREAPQEVASRPASVMLEGEPSSLPQPSTASGPAASEGQPPVPAPEPVPPNPTPAPAIAVVPPVEPAPRPRPPRPAPAKRAREQGRWVELERARALVQAAQQATAAAPSMGRLIIETTPSAQVFVDGKLLGWSPIRRRAHPGLYQVGLQREDCLPLVLDAEVTSGADTRLQLQLVEKVKGPRPPAQPIAAVSNGKPPPEE